MADQDQQSTGNLHVEKTAPPPGSVSAFQMSEEAAKTVAEQTAKYVAEHAADQARSLVPEIPAWMFLVGAAFCGTVAYGAWRALKATAPVLVPVALGVDPTTVFLAQQGVNRLRGARSGAEETPPHIEAAAGPPPGAASLTPETIAAILALAPAFGARSGTAEALGGIVASQAAAAASPPVSRRSSPGSARPSRREPPPEASRTSARSRVPASTRPATAFDEDDAATTRPRGARSPASTTLRSA